MSAVKVNHLKFIFPIFLLLTFFSCNRKKIPKTPAPSSGNRIKSISLSFIGGQMGNYHIIKITQDSVHSEKGLAANNSHQEWNSATDQKLWKNLVSAIDVKTLNHIRSSPSRQAVDGLDETFQIKTDRKVHVYVNAYNDTIHYRQLQNLKNQMLKILPEEYH